MNKINQALSVITPKFLKPKPIEQSIVDKFKMFSAGSNLVLKEIDTMDYNKLSRLAKNNDQNLYIIKSTETLYINPKCLGSSAQLKTSYRFIYKGNELSQSTTLDSLTLKNILTASKDLKYKDLDRYFESLDRFKSSEEFKFKASNQNKGFFGKLIFRLINGLSLADYNTQEIKLIGETKRALEKLKTQLDDTPQKLFKHSIEFKISDKEYTIEVSGSDNAKELAQIGKSRNSARQDLKLNFYKGKNLEANLSYVSKKDLLTHMDHLIKSMEVDA